MLVARLSGARMADAKAYRDLSFPRSCVGMHTLRYSFFVPTREHGNKEKQISPPLRGRRRNKGVSPQQRQRGGINKARLRVIDVADVFGMLIARLSGARMADAKAYRDLSFPRSCVGMHTLRYSFFVPTREHGNKEK